MNRVSNIATRSIRYLASSVALMAIASSASLASVNPDQARVVESAHVHSDFQDGNVTKTTEYSYTNASAVREGGFSVGVTGTWFSTPAQTIKITGMTAGFYFPETTKAAQGDKDDTAKDEATLSTSKFEASNSGEDKDNKFEDVNAFLAGIKAGYSSSPDDSFSFAANLNGGIYMESGDRKQTIKKDSTAKIKDTGLGLDATKKVNVLAKSETEYKLKDEVTRKWTQDGFGFFGSVNVQPGYSIAEGVVAGLDLEGGIIGAKYKFTSGDATWVSTGEKTLLQNTIKASQSSTSSTDWQISVFGAARAMLKFEPVEGVSMAASVGAALMPKLKLEANTEAKSSLTQKVLDLDGITSANQNDNPRLYPSAAGGAALAKDADVQVKGTAIESKKDQKITDEIEGHIRYTAKIDLLFSF